MALAAVAWMTCFGSVAGADLPPVRVLAGGAADPGTGALVLSASDNPAKLGKLAAPVRGKPLFARRPGGLLPAGLDMATAIANGVYADPLAKTLAAAHLDMVRITGVWAFVEPRPDEYVYTSLDNSYKAVLHAGMRPVIQLLSSPGWAVGYRGSGRDDGCNGEFCVQPPTAGNYPRWARFAGAVARRYPLAAAIEIWNEPNLWGFWHAGGVDPVAYEQLLATSYNSIKAANPAMRVLGGALNNLYATRQLSPAECGDRYVAGIATYQDCRSKSDVGYGEFLRAILKAGAASKMDGLSMHPYPIDRAAVGVTRVFGDTQEILAAAGASSLRLVPSETGVDTPSPAFPTDQAQAESILKIYDGLSGEPGGLIVPGASHVDAVLFYEAVELGDGFGWLTQSSTGALTPRPVYCLMADRLGSRPAQCPGGEQFADPVKAAAKKKAKKKAARKTKKRTSSKNARPDMAIRRTYPTLYSLGPD